MALVGNVDITKPYRNLIEDFLKIQVKYNFNSCKDGYFTAFNTEFGAIRKKIFMDIGSFDEKYKKADIEDFVLGIKISEKHQIVLDNQIEIDHRMKKTWLNSMKKVLIVEDEFSIAMDLELYLEELGYQVVGMADAYEQALQLMESEKPHIVLMDIHLKGARTGIEAARVAYQKYKIPVIFLSALSDSLTFADAMETEPFGYLTKPFKEVDLKNLLSIASHQYDLLQIAKNQHFEYEKQTNLEKLHYNEIFFVKDKNKLVSIKVADILWVEALENYSIIFLQDQKVVANLLLKEMYEKLPKEYFTRVHRSYIVAIDKIKRLEDGYIYITDFPIPLSKGHREELLQKIKIV